MTNLNTKESYLSVKSILLTVVLMMVSVIFIVIIIHFHLTIGKLLSIILSSLVTTFFLSYLFSFWMIIIKPKRLKNDFINKVSHMRQESFIGKIDAIQFKEETYQGLSFYLVKVVDLENKEHVFYLLSEWNKNLTINQSYQLLTTSRYLIGWETI